jgi:hypothetical protein
MLSYRFIKVFSMLHHLFLRSLALSDVTLRVTLIIFSIFPVSVASYDFSLYENIEGVVSHLMQYQSNLFLGKRLDALCYVESKSEYLRN